MSDVILKIKSLLIRRALEKLFFFDKNAIRATLDVSGWILSDLKIVRNGLLTSS